jgi:ribose transport system ATP-binding protein
MSDYLVEMHGINKAFPGVQALSDCQFNLKAGEVHALVGENGAGKSTLMKILCGVYTKDTGHIIYKGEEINVRSPRVAQDYGIAMIHQELNLMPHLTVAQNIFIGREPLSRFNFVLDDRQINQQAEELLHSLNLKINPRARVMDMSVARQQMVEITKALSYNSEVLIMDEPTASLTDTEIEELFRMINHLRERGVGIVYISHRLEELFRISDRITVMRDGLFIETLPTTEVKIDKIISLMVGRTIYESAPEIPEERDENIVLAVRDLNRSNELYDVNFELRRGEILGFAGLMGAGRTEVARAIIGADPVDSISLEVMGKSVRIKSPADAVRYGIGYLSEDRKRYGLVTGMDVATNVAMASMKRFLSFFNIVVNDSSIQREAARHVKALDVRTPSVKQKARFLSGGNQQKVVIAKWLTADTDILIFDEPTRGIDVGAKSEIYKLLNDLARQGKSIIMISSELPEILRMSHRVVVMCEGRITGILDASEADQEAIMRLATQRTGVVAK